MNTRSGEALAAEGIARAESAVDQDWLDRMGNRIYALPAGTEFTFNRITEQVGEPAFGSKRALGHLARRLRKEDVIEETGMFVKATNPAQHVMPIRVLRRK